MGMKLGAPGNNAAAVAKVLEAIKILQLALPDLPPGTPVHKAVLGAISGISKHAQPANAQPGIQKTTHRELGREAQQQAPMQALMRMLSQGPGGGAPPGGAAAPAPATVTEAA
jgi:hypothetical protein